VLPAGNVLEDDLAAQLAQLVIERHAEERAAAGHQQRAVTGEGDGVGHVVARTDHDLLVDSPITVAVG